MGSTDDGIPARVRRPLFWDGLSSRLMDAFTGGAFLAGLGIYLGASNLELGVLAALPFLAQAAQLPTLALLLRVQDRQATVLWAAGIARCLLAGIALLLWLRPSALGPAALITILAVNALLVVTATAAWNWWMRDTLPPERLGRFFGRRMRATTIAYLVAILAAGAMLDALVKAGHSTTAFAILFTMGSLWGFAGLVALSRIPHAPPPPSPPARRSLALLREAGRRPETRQAVWALSLVSTAVGFALPFVAVFLIRGLHYGYVTVTGLAVVSQLGYLAGLRGWGHLSDRQGDRGVLLMALALLAFVHLAWAASGWAPAGPLGQRLLLAWLGALHFASGFALGGADLGGTNLMLKSAPQHHAQAHLAAIGLAKAVVAGVGTVAAGWLWGVVGSDALWASGAWSLRGFQLLALVAFGLTALSMVAAARIRGPREVGVVEVARTMRREVSQMSSIAGIRGFIHALSYSVELMAAPFTARPGRGNAATRHPPELRPADGKKWP